MDDILESPPPSQGTSDPAGPSDALGNMPESAENQEEAVERGSKAAVSEEQESGGVEYDVDPSADAEIADRARETERRTLAPDDETADLRVRAHTIIRHQEQLAGTISNVYAGAGRGESASSGLLPPDGLRATVRNYVPVETADQVVNKLTRFGVAYLQGGDRTGRYTTGCYALVAMGNPDKVLALSPGGHRDLDAIVSDRGVLKPGHGHILELASASGVSKQGLSVIAGRLRKLGSQLVIIGPPARAVDASLGEIAVGHSSPDASELLKKRLEWAARDDPEYIERCIEDPDISGYLAGRPGPAEVVDLARQLVSARGVANKPGDVLSRLDSRLRERAAALLQWDEGETGQPAKPAQTRVWLRKLAFRISYVLFYGHNLTLVSAAAGHLFEVLSNPGASPATLIDGGLDKLLGETLVADNGEGDTEAELTWLRRTAPANPRLARAVLSVVWREYDQIRDRLLTWLSLLGGLNLQAVRERAAYLVGLMGTYEFDYVYQNVLKRWANSPSALQRSSAALAMEFIAHDPLWTDQVRRYVGNWSLSSKILVTDTAARTYATALGRMFPYDALVNLVFAASDPEHIRRTVIAEAISQIYSTDTMKDVLVTLEDWNENGTGNHRVHAARALVFLAHRVGAEKPAPWPVLLKQASEDPDAEGRIRDLWKVALSEVLTARIAWTALSRWLMHASGKGELEDMTARFVADLVCEDAMRQRFLWFYLPLWRAGNDQLAVWDRVLKALDEKER